MPTLIAAPTRVEAAGNKPKLIDEYIGRVNSATSAASVAHMRSPGGWQEPGQTPEFDEFTVVLRGTLRVEHHGGAIDVQAGQAVIAHRGEWVRYSTPEAKAPNTSPSASRLSRWIPFTGIRIQAPGGSESLGAAGFEFISFNTNRGFVRFGADHAPRGHELQRANAIQPGRPIHADLHHASQGQFFLGGEQNSAATHVQCCPGTAYSGVPGLNHAIPHILLNRKPVCAPTFREPSDVRTMYCLCLYS